MTIDEKLAINERLYGYSFIPCWIGSDNATNENFKFLVNLLYDSFTFNNGVESVSFNSQVATKISSFTAHNFVVGDQVYIYTDVSGYKGIYNVLNVPNDTSIIIDIEVNTPFTSANVSKVIPYKLLPDLNNEAKLDLSNVIKDFLYVDFQDVPEVWEAPNTKFNFNLVYGAEYKYIFEFQDNFFGLNGSAGFNNATLTALDVDNSPLQIGDKINIQQELYKWSYDNTLDSGGFLAFTSATDDHNFQVGAQITISDQITEPSYNGVTTVTEIIDAKTIKTAKQFVSVTPVEGGNIFGVITPSYNTVATITDKYWDATLGFCIETDLAYTIATPPISGKINFADSRLSYYYGTPVGNKYAYNATLKKLAYGNNGNDFKQYTSFYTPSFDRLFSTILSDGHAIIQNPRKWRIERSSKAWILNHGIGSPVSWKFKDKNNNTISTYLFNDNNFSNGDYYIPVGIDQILESLNITFQSGAPINTVIDDVVWYEIEVGTFPIVRFELNNDCSKFDIYHLCWRDAKGSYISYPFKYIQKNLTEVERKTYYQKEGNFKDDYSFQFDTYGRGDTSYFTRSRDKMILNSGWIEDYETVIIKDLFESPEVMVQLPSGELVGCTIDTNKQEFFKRQTDDLFQYQFEVTMSRNETRF